MVKTNITAALKARLCSHLTPCVSKQLYCIHLKYTKFAPAKLGAQSGTTSWCNNNFGISPCCSLALSVLTQKVWRWDVSYFQSFAHILPILCLLSYSKVGEGRRTFYIPPPSMCYSRKKSPACLSPLHFSTSLTLDLFLCIQIWISHQLKICRRHKATDSTHLGPSTSSFCVVFCIW